MLDPILKPLHSRFVQRKQRPFSTQSELLDLPRTRQQPTNATSHKTLNSKHQNIKTLTVNILGETIMKGKQEPQTVLKKAGRLRQNAPTCTRMLLAEKPVAGNTPMCTKMLLNEKPVAGNAPSLHQNDFFYQQQIKN